MKGLIMEKQLRYNLQEAALFENEVWAGCAKNYVDSFGALGTEAIELLPDGTKVAIKTMYLI